MKNEWNKTNKIIFGSLLGFIILMIIAISFSPEEEKSFEEKLTKSVNTLSSNAELTKLHYNNEYSYITVEYDYKQCVINCKKEFDNHAIKIFKVMDEIKSNETIEYFNIWGYTTFLDDYGNEKSLIAIKYEIPKEEFVKINWDNFTNVEKYITYQHNGL